MHTDKKSISSVILNERVECLKDILSNILNEEVEPIGSPVYNWHWIFSHETPKGETLGLDGHPLTLPEGVPPSFTRRLWCGSSIKFLCSDTGGDQGFSLSSTSKYANLKTGKSGDLAFVPINIEVFVNDIPLLHENRLGVYRKPVKLSINDKYKCNNDIRKNSLEIQNYKCTKVEFTEIDLFRYSALLRVNHRIHYDYIYTTQTEGFPGLVIHGPLLAQVLICYAMRYYSHLNISDMEIKAVNPSFLGEPIRLHVAIDEINNHIVAWSTNHMNMLTMQIKLTINVVK